MDAIGQCHGKPVTILRVEGHRKYFVDEKAFCSIIDQVGDCPIAIYSQNGSRRRGKSLSLNYMKRFLTVDGDINWMEQDIYSDKTFVDPCFRKLNLSDDNQSPQLSDSSEANDFNIKKSENFFWQDGDEDTTQGIVMWSKPFKVTLSDGQQVAVLLMDCQGNASDASDNVDNGVIFSLSMLLSSVFIYNISGDLDNLALQFFHQYADFAVQILENNYSGTLLPPQLISSPIDGPRYNKYFQELIIWVRDWQGHRHYPLGFYSDNREPPNATKNFKLDKADPQFDSDKQSTEVRSVRIAINSMFQRVSCFLSPFPGEKVVSEDFNGYIEPTSQFGQCMKQFVEITLSPTNIVTKFIGKRKLYSSDLKSYFLKWASVYRDAEKLPKFKSATETSHELICRDAIKEAWDHYMEQMSIVSKLSVPLEPDAFKQRHTELVKECLEKYKATASVGLFQVKLKFMKELVTQIEKSYSSFVDNNNERWERIHQDL
jgi:atlastin